MAATRIYAVRDGKTLRLVRATHPAHALRHVADETFEVTVAGQEELVKALADGAKVEDIKAEQQQLPT